VFVFPDQCTGHRATRGRQVPLHGGPIFVSFVFFVIFV